ncbi:MAG TPA: cytochrome c oxidase subunit II [Kofleriaceae bacterium]|nr:cytochrome c oxidase subunit II [Kofleriaceae bacterium]
MSSLDPAGPQARSIEGLWDVFWWVSIAVWSAVVVVHVIAIVRARRQRRRWGEADPTHTHPAQTRRLLAAVIGASAITVITLAGLLVTTFVTGNALAALDEDPDPLTIKVTAHQWWWQLDYAPGSPDAAAPTANEMHIPVGRTVRLLLTSADVIHSFWVPSLHGKRDVIPTRTNVLLLRADQAGVYRGPCAEFCGLQHANMTITVVAEPPDVFARWLATQRADAPARLAEPALHGREVFLATACAGCHTIRGTHAGGRLGPDLTHVAGRATLAAGAIPNTRGHLGGWILDPQAIKPGCQMPPVRLAGDDQRALLAYLEALR